MSTRSVSAEVLIPHHNRVELLRSCLDALREQTINVPVCVIDNASTNASVDVLRSEYPEVRVLELATNTGFGTALNRGVASSQANLLIFLNNDAVADSCFVEAILREAAHGADMIAACLRRPDGSIDSCGVQVDRSLIVYDYLHGAPYPPRSAPPMPPLGPCGGAAAYTREAFDEVGGFDEAFFAYLEDADLALRLRRRGKDCVLAIDAFAWHRHAGTLGAGAPLKNRLMGESRGHLLWKHGGGLSSRDRARGMMIDIVTYGGQALMDRNIGAVRGRVAAFVSRRGKRRPGHGTGLEGVPMLELSAVESLQTRWGRGRRYRGRGDSS